MEFLLQPSMISSGAFQILEEGLDGGIYEIFLLLFWHGFPILLGLANKLAKLVDKGNSTHGHVTLIETVNLACDILCGTSKL